MKTDSIDLSTQNFETEVLASELPFVVYFWADWCTLSTALTPVLQELAAEYEGKIKLGRVDIDAQRALANEYRIQDTPTLIFFQKGNVLRRLTGDASRSRLEEMFEQMAEVAAVHI